MGEIRGARHPTVITFSHATREDVVQDCRDLPDLLSGGRCRGDRQDPQEEQEDLDRNYVQ